MISHSELRARQSAKVIRALLDADAWKAVLYVAPDEVVRATRRYYARGRKPDPKRIEVLVTIGRPNFLERKFIKEHPGGATFPIAKIQLKFRKYAKPKPKPKP